jgi:hypothetical protein
LSALGYLRTDKAIVLDPSAIAASILTDSFKRLEAMEHPIIVPASALVRLKQNLDNDRRFSGDGSLAPHGSRFIYLERTPEETELQLKRRRDVIKWLESHASIIGGLPLAYLPADTRNEMVDYFGQSTAEAIAIAESRQAILCTDDIMVAAYAVDERRVARVWTQAVLLWAHQDGKITANEYDAHTAILLSNRYRHVYLTPGAVVRVAREADWRFNSWPFGSVLNWLGDCAVMEEGVRIIAANLLRTMFYETSEFTKNTSAAAVLSTINSRIDGWKIIGDLRSDSNAIADGNDALARWLDCCLAVVWNPSPRR